MSGNTNTNMIENTNTNMIGNTNTNMSRNKNTNMWFYKFLLSIYHEKIRQILISVDVIYHLFFLLLNTLQQLDNRRAGLCV